ncbi:hypothetical protein FRC03_005679 [Tulasnella sp. 419]|nr:hypothetical protein FRC03_005679 [Tulasnella sp. 419]
MEDTNDKLHLEVFIDCQCQSNQETVEDDTKLEDRNPNDLGCLRGIECDHALMGILFGIKDYILDLLLLVVWKDSFWTMSGMLSVVERMSVDVSKYQVAGGQHMPIGTIIVDFAP